MWKRAHRPVSHSAIAFAVVLSLGFLASCSDAQGNEGRPSSEGTPVSVATARADRVEIGERSMARSEAFSSPVVSAEVGGLVQKVLRDVGDRVEAGELLAQVESQQYRHKASAAAADVEALKVRLEHARRELARLEQLGNEQHVSQSDVEGADADMRTTQEQLRAAENRRDEARRELDRTGIRAPMAGRVDARMISEGDYVRSGDPAFRMVPDASARVALPFPERVGDRLEEGMTARIRRLSRDDEPWVAGELTRIRPSVDEDGMGVVAIVEFEPPESWRSGTLLEGVILVERREGAVLVPSESVRPRPGRRVVFVVPGDGDGGEVEEREVEVGHRDVDEVEILEGVAAGERVVVDGADYLAEGTRVRIRAER
jgi:membrane fusion protein, multidrug efflux system